MVFGPPTHHRSVPDLSSLRMASRCCAREIDVEEGHEEVEEEEQLIHQ